MISAGIGSSTVSLTNVSSPIDILPTDTLFWVFRFLDIRDQSRAARVCRKWQQAALNPNSELGFYHAIWRRSFGSPSIVCYPAVYELESMLERRGETCVIRRELEADLLVNLKTGATLPFPLFDRAAPCSYEQKLIFATFLSDNQAVTVSRDGAVEWWTIHTTALERFHMMRIKIEEDLEPYQKPFVVHVFESNHFLYLQSCIEEANEDRSRITHWGCWYHVVDLKLRTVANITFANPTLSGVLVGANSTRIFFRVQTDLMACQLRADGKLVADWVNRDVLHEFKDQIFANEHRVVQVTHRMFSNDPAMKLQAFNASTGQPVYPHSSSVSQIRWSWSHYRQGVLCGDYYIHRQGWDITICHIPSRNCVTSIDLHSLAQVDFHILKLEFEGPTLKVFFTTENILKLATFPLNTPENARPHLPTPFLECRDGWETTALAVTCTALTVGTLMLLRRRFL